MRGINSIQLIFDGRRWWIVTIYWEHESPEHPIPAKYSAVTGIQSWQPEKARTGLLGGRGVFPFARQARKIVADGRQIANV